MVVERISSARTLAVYFKINNEDTIYTVENLSAEVYNNFITDNNYCLNYMQKRIYLKSRNWPDP